MAENRHAICRFFRIAYHPRETLSAGPVARPSPDSRRTGWNSTNRPRNFTSSALWSYALRLGQPPSPHCLSELETSMNSAQIDQKSYEMPPREGISIAHFLTVADVERSARYYEKVFGARILTMGDGNAPPYLQLANIWMILNVGGGPTPDNPTVTLTVPDPHHINSFMNFRVADIQAR